MTAFDRAILNLLNLDSDNVIKITIVMEAAKQTTVTVEMAVFKDNLLLMSDGVIQTITKQYKVIEDENRS